MDDRLVALSKTLAYLLRHDPGAARLELDDAGWVDVEILMERLNATGHPITAADLYMIVNDSAKARYEISRGRIRAAQGHSIAVDLGLTPTIPPAQLFHGTVERVLVSIFDHGLRPGGRAHVHLSADHTSAKAVGARRGRPVVVTVAAGAMHADGHEFRSASNGVWLVDHVPPEYLTR